MVFQVIEIATEAETRRDDVPGTLAEGRGQCVIGEQAVETASECRDVLLRRQCDF